MQTNRSCFSPTNQAIWHYAPRFRETHHFQIYSSTLLPVLHFVLHERLDKNMISVNLYTDVVEIQRSKNFYSPEYRLSSPNMYCRSSSRKQGEFIWEMMLWIAWRNWRESNSETSAAARRCLANFFLFAIDLLLKRITQNVSGILLIPTYWHAKYYLMKAIKFESDSIAIFKSPWAAR